MIMMKVILWMGMSVNGIIARENNEEDFISHDCWLAWLEVLRENGSLLFGRKTYEIVKTWPKQYFDDLKGIKVIVVSSNKKYLVGDGFELASSPHEALEKLKEEGFEGAILTGGSTLNSSFAKSNLIDEIVLNIEPVIIGKGIPVFNPDVFDLKLKLLEMKKSRGKTIQLKYRVVK